MSKLNYQDLYVPMSSHLNFWKPGPSIFRSSILDFFGFVSRWECDDFNAKQDWVLWKLGSTPAVRFGMFFSGCLDSKKLSEKPGIRKQTKVETFEMIIMILGIFE